MKSVLSYLWGALEDHWALIILLLAVFAFALGYQNAVDKVALLTEQVKVEKAAQEVLRSAYIAETEKFNAEVAQERLERGLLIAEIQKSAEKREADSKVKQAQQIAGMKLDFKREKERLSIAYEKRIKTLKLGDGPDLVSDDSGRLRVDASINSGDSKEGETGWESVHNPASEAGYTGSKSECHSDLADLVRACRLTTIHFNRAREWIDTACLSVQCGDGEQHATAR